MFDPNGSPVPSSDCKDDINRVRRCSDVRPARIMTDALLTIQDRQEALSRAYANVIAAGAGYSTYAPCDFDRDSIDLGFNAGGGMRPNLHVQLKATINLRKSGDFFKFQLSKKNYDDLRVETQVHRIIIVLALPKKEAIWLSVTLERLIIRRCAYWLSLKGMAELPENQESIAIALPASNRFDVDGLKKLMEMARKGDIA
jgi:hypothetical protein